MLNKNTDQFIFEKPFRDFFHFFRILSLLSIGGFGWISFCAWKSVLVAEVSERGFLVIMAGIFTIVTVIYFVLTLKQNVRTNRLISLRYSICNGVLKVWNKWDNYQLDLNVPIYFLNITIPFYYGKTSTSFDFTILSDCPLTDHFWSEYGTDAIEDILDRNYLIFSTSVAENFCA